MTSPDLQLEFVHAYWAGDAGVTVSRTLMSDLLYMFLFDGKVASTHFDGKARRRVIAVAVVEDGVGAGIVAESLAEQDVVRPRLGTADREVGSAVTEHALARDVFDDGFRVMNVSAEFFGSLARNELMMVAMARDFVRFAGDLPDHRGVSGGDLS